MARRRGLSKKQKRALKKAEEKAKQQNNQNNQNFNNNRKGGKKMFKGITKAFTVGGANHTLPDDKVEEFTTLNVVMFKQSTLNKIRDIGLPAAGGSEYQVHYRGIQFIIESQNIAEDPRRIVFTIPTVFFNFPQKVTSVAVDFNLNEVAEISEQCIQISDPMAQQIAASFPTQRFIDAGWKVQARENEMGSIHRHPGAFGFSGTDLDNKADNPGVIFRNLETQDKIQVDSVMYIPSAHANVTLVTTETRIVDVKPVDTGIEGVYARARTITFIAGDSVEETAFGDFFGGTADTSVSMDFTMKKDKYTDKDIDETLEEIIKEFMISSSYEPIVIMDPNFIESTTYSYSYKKPQTYNYGHQRGSHHYGGYNHSLYGDEEDEFDHLDNPISTKKVLPASTGSNTTLNRPAWKKNQTINALRIKGIDANEHKDITGDASDADIIAIATEMKALDYSDTLIRDLFSQMSYPQNALSVYYQHLSDSIKVTETVKEVEAGLAEEPEIIAEVETVSQDNLITEDDKISLELK